MACPLDASVGILLATSLVQTWIRIRFDQALVQHIGVQPELDWTIKTWTKVTCNPAEENNKLSLSVQSHMGLWSGQHRASASGSIRGPCQTKWQARIKPYRLVQVGLLSAPALAHRLFGHQIHVQVQPHPDIGLG